MPLPAVHLVIAGTVLSIFSLMTFTMRTASSAPASLYASSTTTLPPMTSQGLLSALLTSAVTSSGSSSPAPVTNAELITTCPQVKLAASSEWLASEGPWAQPCSGNANSQDETDLFQSLFGDVTVDGSDVVVELKEASDIAANLCEKLSTAALREFLANESMIPGARDEYENKTSNSSSLVEREYERVSTALVYLEQCEYDTDHCAADDSVLLPIYSQLQSKLLKTLCRMQEVLDSVKGTRPVVKRDVMLAQHRDVTEVEERNMRDYVIANDVRMLLNSVVLVFQDL